MLLLLQLLLLVNQLNARRRRTGPMLQRFVRPHPDDATAAGIVSKGSLRW